MEEDCSIHSSATYESFKHGVFPSKLKTAVVKPIIYRGETCLIGNYRPLSMISTI